MSIENQPHFCVSCGNKGVLELVGKYSFSFCEDDDDDPNFCPSYIDDYTWYFFKCPTCNHPVLVEQCDVDWFPSDSYVKTVYPNQTIPSVGVPEKIANAFHAAMRTKGIDSAICLLSLRRTLEMICKDKQAQGRDLKDMIDNLISRKELPDLMSDACWIVRQNGNDAAHGDDVFFSSDEVDEVIHYVATVIEYLYSLPIKVSALRGKIEKRKASKKSAEKSE